MSFGFTMEGLESSESSFSLSNPSILSLFSKFCSAEGTMYPKTTFCKNKISEYPPAAKK